MAKTSRAKKLEKTMVSVHGSKRAWRKYMATIGSAGGKASNTSWFTENPERAREAAKLGGSRGIKGYKLIKKEPGLLTYRNKKTGGLMMKTEVEHGD